MARQLSIAVAVSFLALFAACGSERSKAPAKSAPAKHFPAPIFEGLSLGMTRAEATRVHGLRASLTSSGKNYRVWVYEKKGDYVAHLTFDGKSESARLERIDVHYGRSNETAAAVIGRFEARLGAPDFKRREPMVSSYAGAGHRQFETTWSDSTQYVFLIERVPLPGRKGNPVYYLTIRGRNLAAEGPPTGYVPPPPPLDDEGKPTEEPLF